MPAASPRIENLSWGRIEVQGGRSFKDAKLFPGGACEWDWGATGTHHSPGTQPADVEEILERGARVMVLSRGVLRRLRICPATLEMLAARGIPVHVLPTGRAARLYNQLRESEAVGGLFHTTC